MLPTEPIGSLPRPASLLEAQRGLAAGTLSAHEHAAAVDAAVADTLERFAATGSPVVTDGEQAKPSFATYALAGLTNLSPEGVTIAFADGHTRRLPALARGPFRYALTSGAYVRAARRHTRLPLKQAVIAPSALSLLYPAAGLPGYPREQFIADLTAGCVADIRDAFAAGAESVQLDFTEGRLAVKLDPSKGVLRAFVDLNNAVLARLSPAERAKVGVHTCPGGDHDSTHSADVDYAELLPDLFRLDAARFFVALAGERDRTRTLRLVRAHLRPGQRVYVGVTNPLTARVETPEEVRDAVLEAASILPLDQLGTCDDCGFSPFADDTSTSREVAFAKIAARVRGTELASKVLGA
ncbi:MAG: 5-methyltetrahydropteroyltriglutamate--homocysteine methyltransferase [Planctomycetia bacterium]